MIDVTGSSDALGPSPIAVEGPARDGPWFLHGARVNAEGNQRRGLEFVTSGGRVMMTGCVGSDGPASAARLDPGVVTRSWSDRAVQRTWVPPKLPLLVWEIEGAAAGALEWRTPVGGDGSIDRLDAHFAEVVHGNGERVWFAASGGSLSAQPQDGVARFRFEYSGSARVVAIAVADDADGARTRDHLARRGISGLAAQRAQHAAHLGKLGTRLRTPEDSINRAFSWAAALCEAAASSGALNSPAGDTIAQALRAAGLQGAVREAGKRAIFEGPVPAEGLLSRLRESAGLVDEGSATMFGPDASRAAATLIDGVHGLFGATPDEAGSALSLKPALPHEWRSMALDRLRVGAAVIDLEVRRRPSATAVALRVRSGGPLTVSIGLPEAAVVQVDLDDVVMPAEHARFEARHEHLLVFSHDD